MVHIPIVHAKRAVHVAREPQDDNLLSTPTGAEFTGARTLDGTATNSAALAFDTIAPANGGESNPTFQVSTSTTPPTFTPKTSSSPTSSPTAESKDSSSNSLPLGTVIGACVGALVGAIILISVGVWLYRRSDPRKKKRGPQRDANGRSGKSWNQLGDDGDNWEGMNKAKGLEMSEQKPEENTMDTMFRKSPSVRTEYTKTEELPSFNLTSHPFAAYHPNLAKEMASTDSKPPAPPFLQQIESSPISWNTENVARDSFLSLNSTSKRVSGSMSPSLDMAIPTPPINLMEHRWESAEVLNFDGQSAEIATAEQEMKSNNPFRGRRKSDHNPFFKAESQFRSSSQKGKKRELVPSTTTDNEANTENPFVNSHVKVDSLSSVTSNDRAIQSLLAALDATPRGSSEEARLRVASMQSAQSATSMYTADEMDVTDKFPLPPS